MLIELRNPPAELMQAFSAYREARVAFLAHLRVSSNRDPVAEFSEALVAQVIGGRLAESRVQRGYDVLSTAGVRVQVKYLTNPGDRWVNEHHFSVPDEADRYAIVFFEALAPVAVIVFPRDLGPVCSRLRKRHPNQESVLQFTRTNFWQVLDEAEAFRELGVDVIRLGTEFRPSRLQR
jgi:hypothetical protein